MQAKIRAMQAEDLNRVRQIERCAFADWWRQWHGGREDLAPRTHANLKHCLAMDPDGCFVAELDQCLLGFIFSRTWGRVGWFGTFGVLPEYQGQGLGQRLIAASLGYLKEEPGRVIGLETMPEAPGNLGLYGRLGFEVRLPTLLLEREIRPQVELASQVQRWSQAGEAVRCCWLQDLRQGAAGIYRGLDYSKELLSYGREGRGEVLVLLERETAMGASILQRIPDREGQDRRTANLRALFLAPQVPAKEGMRLLLRASEALAAEHGFETLGVSCNGRHAGALDLLYAEGYRVRRVMARMVLRGTDAGPRVEKTVDLSRWAG